MEKKIVETVEVVGYFDGMQSDRLENVHGEQVAAEGWRDAIFGIEV